MRNIIWKYTKTIRTHLYLFVTEESRCNAVLLGTIYLSRQCAWSDVFLCRTCCCCCDYCCRLLKREGMKVEESNPVLLIWHTTTADELWSYKMTAVMNIQCLWLSAFKLTTARDKVFWMWLISHVKVAMDRSVNSDSVITADTEGKML